MIEKRQRTAGKSENRYKCTIKHCAKLVWFLHFCSKSRYKRFLSFVVGYLYLARIIKNTPQNYNLF
jgi:hypothetical protein